MIFNMLMRGTYKSFTEIKLIEKVIYKADRIIIMFVSVTLMLLASGCRISLLQFPANMLLTQCWHDVSCEFSSSLGKISYADYYAKSIPLFSYFFKLGISHFLTYVEQLGLDINVTIICKFFFSSKRYCTYMLLWKKKV